MMPEAQKRALYRQWWPKRNAACVNQRFQTLTKAERFKQMTGQAMDDYHEQLRRERMTR